LRVSRIHRLPFAVLATTFFIPIAIGIPVIAIPEVIGWQMPPWWAIAQLFFLPGFFSAYSVQFIPCWDLLRWSDDSILASYAIHDTLSYVSVSMSWLLSGFILYAATLAFSRGKIRFGYAFTVAIVGLLSQIIFPLLILLDLELWALTAVIPLPFPALISVLGLVRKRYHHASWIKNTS